MLLFNFCNGQFHRKNSKLREREREKERERERMIGSIYYLAKPSKQKKEKRYRSSVLEKRGVGIHFPFFGGGVSIHPLPFLLLPFHLSTTDDDEKMKIKKKD